MKKKQKKRKWNNYFNNLPSICFPATIDAAAVRLEVGNGVGE